MSENRVISGQFQKGQSGNPGGRPAKKAELAVSCREMTPDILQTIQGIIANNEAKDADRISASRLVLEYGFGRPSQTVEVDVSTKVEEMSDEQRRARIRELQAKAAIDIETDDD
ncbi:DUF5681 domain-containing protein [Pelosinus sp. sgz500959]|uniref:DUF5681 domain-containing protein n=1 Tax=Pelosinus sp. sgz500959 TaxID=3242472 RepID=UPI00366CBB6D